MPSSSSAARRLAVRLERLRRAAGPMACAHPQLPRPLAEWMLPDERLKLRDDVGRVTELDVRRDPFFDRDEAELVESADLVLRPPLERELGERRAAPEFQRPQEQRASLLWGRPTCVPQQLLEALGVDLIADTEACIPAPASPEPAGRGPSAARRSRSGVTQLRSSAAPRRRTHRQAVPWAPPGPPAGAARRAAHAAADPRERPPPARPSPRAARGSERKASVTRL